MYAYTLFKGSAQYANIKKGACVCDIVSYICIKNFALGYDESYI